MINPWDGEGIFHLQSSPRLLVNHLGPGERRAVVLVPRAGKLRLPSLPPPLVPKGNSSNRPRHGHLLASPAAPGHECRNQYRCYFTRKKKKLQPGSPQLCSLAVVKGLLHRLCSCFSPVPAFPATSLPWKAAARLSHLRSQQFKGKCCFALRCLPFQLGQTAINTAHPVLHSNCCESLRL